MFNEFDELFAIEDKEVANNNKISNIVKPVVDVIVDTINRLKSDLDTNQITESISEITLLQTQANDINKIISALSGKNRFNSINSNTEALNFDETKELVDDLINKYKLKDVAKAVSDSYKQQAIELCEANEEIEEEIAQLDELFK